MTASMAGVVLCSALLSAMALWYGVRMGAVPLSRRLAAMAIPLTQACALVAFGAFAMRDPFLDRFVPYVVFATVACLVADGLALPSLSLGARKESARIRPVRQLSCWKRHVRARPLLGERCKRQTTCVVAWFRC